MTVKELRRYIRGLDENTDVYIAISDSNKVLEVVSLYVEESPDGVSEMYMECDFV